jgi:hypothetical protein
MSTLLENAPEKVVAPLVAPSTNTALTKPCSHF